MKKEKLLNKAKEVRATMDKNSEAAADFAALLNALPPGQVKNLLKDETCAAILKKYGIE